MNGQAKDVNAPPFTLSGATGQADYKEILAMLLEVMSKGYFVRLTASQVHEPPKQHGVMFTARVGHSDSHPRLVVTIIHLNALEALTEAFKQCQDRCLGRDVLGVKRCAKCGSDADIFCDEDQGRFPWRCDCSSALCYGSPEIAGTNRQDVIVRWNKAQS